MSEIATIPNLIQEILYPSEIPDLIRSKIEAAINQHNESNYVLAIQNFESARQEWSKYEGRDLPDQTEMYFEFQKAQVYHSAGRDDFALKHFIGSKTFGDKLVDSADKAIPYSGLGIVLYNTEEYEYGLRAFLKSREIRESLLGLQNVDTATTFNNCGACMFMINRTHEVSTSLKGFCIFQNGPRNLSGQTRPVPPKVTHNRQKYIEMP